MNWITNSVLPKIKAWVQSDDVPDNLWIKCPSCSQMIFNKDYEQQFNCCPGCNHHAPLRPQQRFALLFDNSEFEPIAVASTPDDPLKFKDNKRYPDRLKAARTKTGADDAIAIAAGTIGDKNAVVAAFDFQFMGGSMGRTVGDGLLRASEEAVARGCQFNRCAIIWRRENARKVSCH
jgi:acetyl-CoA carboxylase carboxyl transferase subunit beta